MPWSCASGRCASWGAVRRPARPALAPGNGGAGRLRLLCSHGTIWAARARAQFAHTAERLATLTGRQACMKASPGMHEVQAVMQVGASAGCRTCCSPGAGPEPSPEVLLCGVASSPSKLTCSRASRLRAECCWAGAQTPRWIPRSLRACCSAHWSWPGTAASKQGSPQPCACCSCGWLQAQAASTAAPWWAHLLKGAPPA